MPGVYFSNFDHEILGRKFEERNRFAYKGYVHRGQKRTLGRWKRSRKQKYRRGSVSVSLCHPLEVKKYTMAFKPVITETKCCIHIKKYLQASFSTLTERILLQQPPLTANKTQSMFILSLRSKDTESSRRRLNGFT